MGKQASRDLHWDLFRALERFVEIFECHVQASSIKEMPAVAERKIYGFLSRMSS